jgi:peptidoglycan L-alanyl-D-glutamate endopeptidase CwlK
MASRKITDMIPEMQELFAMFAERMADAGIDFVVTCTLRTQEDQDALYAKGRTVPGQIVTWTRSSKHCQGKAFDIAVMSKGKITWDPALYQEPGKIGMEVGLQWGGAWLKNRDLPHFEYREK